MNLHPSITADRVIEAAEISMFGASGNPGFCIACGADQDGCEPDAREYICTDCNEPQVYGAEELLHEFA
jgi:hypothetical protein